MELLLLHFTLLNIIIGHLIKAAFSLFSGRSFYRSRKIITTRERERERKRERERESVISLDIRVLLKALCCLERLMDSLIGKGGFLLSEYTPKIKIL